MPIKHFNILLLLSCLFAGCTTSTHICVYDSLTKVPVGNAFVYVNEHKMFDPFNGSNIYMTDARGCVDIAEHLRDGQVSVFAGKSGYDLNMFTRDFEGKDNVKLFIAKTKTPKIKSLFIRPSLLDEGSKESLLKEFFRYCEQQKITFYTHFPKSEVRLENGSIRVAEKRQTAL